jgi:acetyl esterase/lipase
MLKKQTLAFLFPLLTFFSCSAQEQISLWPNGAPGFGNRRSIPEEAKDYWVKTIHNPSIAVYLPPKEKATGAAVIICPGGGHRLLVYNAEGRDAALYLNSLGVAAFVLKYRLFRQDSAERATGAPSADSPAAPHYTLEKEVKMDAYRAMRLVRSRASEWGVDTGRLGMLGFSAGGEVVALVAYAPGTGDPQAPDPIDRLNGRPNFQMLVYPGPLGIPDMVPKDAPPAFLIAANDDECCAVPIVKLLERYREAKAPVEAHILSGGSHGFNMGNRSKLQAVKTWPQRMADWMSDMGLLQPHK